MARLVWSEKAILATAEIGEFIQRDSPTRARRMVSRIYASAERLPLFPMSGRVVPEYGLDDVREIIVRPYRVIYRVEDDLVEILIVRHGARRLDDLPDS